MTGIRCDCISTGPEVWVYTHIDESGRPDGKTLCCNVIWDDESGSLINSIAIYDDRSNHKLGFHDEKTQNPIWIVSGFQDKRYASYTLKLKEELD